MKITALKFLSVVIFTLSTCFATLASAQEKPLEKSAPNHQGWYQVEMIIFSRKNPALQEHFPSNIHLGYPSRWQVLKDPNAITTESGLAITTTDSTLYANDPKNIQTTSASVDLNTQPFYMLPAEFRQLNLAANKFARSSEHSLIFHQAWRQPISSQNQADWILINNTRANEQAPLLSGSIRLSVATYLRLDTRLWFAEFESKIDDTPGIWPEIPESPDQIIQEIDASQSEFFSNQNNNETPSEELVNTEQWQTKRIVLLKDKREMRSNEIHYIDHPLVGIIIKISPFTPAQTPAESATTGSLQ